VAVAATGAREARGGRWGGLSVPKPPKGVAESGSESGGRWPMAGSGGRFRIRHTGPGSGSGPGSSRAGAPLRPL
jgi:hypothetical protein